MEVEADPHITMEEEIKLTTMEAIKTSKVLVAEDTQEATIQVTALVVATQMVKETMTLRLLVNLFLEWFLSASLFQWSG